MTAFEIILVIIGLIIFAGSFFVSEKFTASSEQLKAAIDENEIKKLLKLQINNMDDEMNEVINEAVENSTDDVKRSMEKLSNEKIMAINEYSDTVMDSINKNHNEVMFLYGMLNEKNTEIRETADLITKANKGINKKIAEAQAVLEKMDLQIAEMNQFTANQKESMDKLTKSAATIEILEEQIRNIEQMSVQFSNDIKDAETSKHKVKSSSIDEKAFDLNSKAVEEELYDFEQADYTEKEALYNAIKIGEAEEDFADVLENISRADAEQNEISEDASNYNSKILDMNKNGSTALEIAKSLGLGVGEVQLVIDLFEGGRR
jgi:hypothetical protein